MFPVKDWRRVVCLASSERVRVAGGSGWAEEVLLLVVWRALLRFGAGKVVTKQ